MNTPHEGYPLSMCARRPGTALSIASGTIYDQNSGSAAYGSFGDLALMNWFPCPKGVNHGQRPYVSSLGKTRNTGCGVGTGVTIVQRRTHTHDFLVLMLRLVAPLSRPLVLSPFDP